MKKWLNEDEDRLDNVDLWGSNIKTYHFPELIDWVNKGGSLKKKKKGVSVEASASDPGMLKNVAKASKSASSSKKAATGSRAGTSRRK